MSSCERFNNLLVYFLPAVGAHASKDYIVLTSFFDLNKLFPACLSAAALDLEV